MIKLVASDVDGTILKYSESNLRESIFDMVDKLSEKGILFVAASGRPLCELKALFEPVAHKMGFVCNDGALTLLGNEVIDINPIDVIQAVSLINDIYSFEDCEFMAYCKDKAYIKPKKESYAISAKELLCGHDVKIRNADEIEEEILKIAVYNANGIADIQEYFLPKYGETFEVAYAANEWIEFNATGISKAVGIRKLIDRLGITSEQCMAFGDSFNDITMFESVKYSFAMESAKEEVKKHCSFLCKNVEETVRKILL